MAGTAVIDDDFTGLALNATISGRVPTVCDSGASYVVDVGATGGGSGDVKFTGAGAAVKIRSLLTSGASQVIIDDKGGNEEFGVFTRDTANTPYPRWGYIAMIKTRSAGGTNGTFTIGSITNYTQTVIGSYLNVPWTFASSGINTVALESIANNHRLIINNVVAASFTNTAYPDVINYNKYGVTFQTAASPSVLRMNRFSVYDSIVVTGSSAYVIVTVA